ncbi:unnamed protein product [Prunus armeniaca]
MVSVTSANSGFSPGKTCPWACSGTWDPPPNRATGPALELPRAPSSSLSPGLGFALEMLLGFGENDTCHKEKEESLKENIRENVTGIIKIAKEDNNSEGAYMEVFAPNLDLEMSIN